MTVQLSLVPVAICRTVVSSSCDSILPELAAVTGLSSEDQLSRRKALDANKTCNGSLRAPWGNRCSIHHRLLFYQRHITSCNQSHTSGRRVCYQSRCVPPPRVHACSCQISWEDVMRRGEMNAACPSIMAGVELEWQLSSRWRAVGQVRECGVSSLSSHP